MMNSKCAALCILRTGWPMFTQLPMLMYVGNLQSSVQLLSPSNCAIATMAACLPCYPVNADSLEILHSPSDFYRMIKSEIRSATRHITMAALYLGSDKLEHELVKCLSDRLEESNVNFSILLDHVRGTRGRVNSCSLLQSLVDNFHERATVALYHTPHLRGLLKTCLPGRLTEAVGLNHIKIFVFDDNVMISGANLSESYFTNRQDRYIMIRDSRDLAEFFHELVRTVATFSMELKKGGQIQPHPDCPTHPFTGDREHFLGESRRRIMTLLQKNIRAPNNQDLLSMSKSELRTEMQKWMDSCHASNVVESSPNTDTVIYPLVQMGHLGIHFDEMALTTILERAEENSRIYLASGYFNLTEEYIDRILNKSYADYRILSASPQVNGFYGARGMAGAVPDVYTQVSKQFCDRIRSAKADDRVKLYEYYRSRWTFHVKGLWYYPPGASLPTLSLIGSPNFGYRSVYRDLETQIAIVTRNVNLQERLHEEKERVYQPSEEVNRSTYDLAERKVPLWVRVGTYFVKSFF